MNDTATKARSAIELKVRSEIAGPVRVMTAERIDWYDTAMLCAGNDRFTKVGANIHTDEEFAKGEGLPAVIADGMIMTNWCSSMLIEHFGMDYVERGELRTKFIKPVFLGQTLSCRGRVKSVDQRDNGARVYDLEVWCEVDGGLKVVDGDAKVEVAGRS